MAALAAIGGGDAGEDIPDEFLDEIQEALFVAPCPAEALAEEAAHEAKAARTAGRCGADAAPRPCCPLLGHGLLTWPVEIRRGIATYLAWHEVLLAALLCRAWRSLEQDVTLWWAHFVLMWPKHAARQVERVKGPQDWRLLFRTRWRRGHRDGDATQEDWLDFYAAREASAGNSGRRSAEQAAAAAAATEREARLLQLALEQCRGEVLKSCGVAVPLEPDPRHTCSSRCRFHKLPDSGDAFVCEASGVLHQCRRGEACQMCVVSVDECFLVCPASGMSYERLNYINEVPDEVDVWDPAIGESEQLARWFEQGYGMSEEQARQFFPE